jgi:hypothetical protein|tara:strand:- start:16975 stop:17190 length:216 start_codon:yes stop_codon:yes gene_type:complete
MGGAVRKIFKAPKPPPPPPPPAAPKAVTAAPAGTAARKNVRSKYSRKNTILTGGQGVQEEAEIVKKTLLGA